MLSIPESLSKKTVLKYTTERDIFEYYLGFSIELKQMYISPLRKEGTPSFNIYINRYNGRLWFKDFGDRSGDCFRLVQHLHGDCSFKEALAIVNRDMNLNIGYGKTQIIKAKAEERKLIAPPPKRISVKIQSFTRSDLYYWKQLNLKESHLNYFKVFSIFKTWINDYPIFDWTYSYSNPIYGYYYSPNKKLYRPREKDKKKKWLSDLEPNQWLGLQQLPPHMECLLIAKSYKDVMFLRTLGLYAVSPPSENTLFLLTVIESLKRRAKNLFLFYDNDEVGIREAENKAEEHDLLYVHIPKDYPKDPTDFYLEFGMHTTLELLDELGILKYAKIK